MKRLEDRLQVSLFDRSQKTPRLNQLGKALVPKAQEVVRQYEAMLDDLTGDAELIGQLKLGSISSAIRALIPLSVKRLVNNYSKLQIQVTPGLSTDLAEQVERGVLDAAVIAEQVSLSNDMNWKPFAKEEMVLLTAQEIEETDPTKLLETMPFIRNSRRASVSHLTEEWLRKNKVSVRSSMEMESLDALCSMVAHNLGVAIVPNLCVPDAVFASLRKIPLETEATPRILGVLTRVDCSKIRLVDKLLDELTFTVDDENRSTN